MTRQRPARYLGWVSSAKLVGCLLGMRWLPRVESPSRAGFSVRNVTMAKKKAAKKAAPKKAAKKAVKKAAKKK